MKTLIDQKTTTPPVNHSASDVAKVEGLDAVANQVASDSRREPERYLDETIVPHGGE